MNTESLHFVAYSCFWMLYKVIISWTVTIVLHHRKLLFPNAVEGLISIASHNCSRKTMQINWTEQRLWGNVGLSHVLTITVLKMIELIIIASWSVTILKGCCEASMHITDGSNIRIFSMIVLYNSFPLRSQTIFIYLVLSRHWLFSSLTRYCSFSLHDSLCTSPPLSGTLILSLHINQRS